MMWVAFLLFSTPRVWTENEQKSHQWPEVGFQSVLPPSPRWRTPGSRNKTGPRVCYPLLGFPQGSAVSLCLLEVGGVGCAIPRDTVKDFPAYFKNGEGRRLCLPQLGCKGHSRSYRASRALGRQSGVRLKPTLENNKVDQQVLKKCLSM